MITEFIQHLETNRGLSGCTLRAYTHDLKKFTAWARKNVTDARWSAISQCDVEEYVRHLVERGEERTTIKREVSALRSFYNFQVYHGRMTCNPARYVSTPKTEKRLPETISTREISNALDATSAGDDTHAIIAMIAETGMRISEVLTLTWEQIDERTRTIRVHGKGRKERVVRYGERTATTLAARTGTRTGMLFTAKGERDYRHDVWALMREHTDAGKCSPHTLRHAFACAHIEAGTDIKTLSVMMGHESVKTTEIYAQVAGARLLQSFNNIQI